MCLVISICCIINVSAMDCPDGHSMVGMCLFEDLDYCRAERITNCKNSNGCYYYYATTRWFCDDCMFVYIDNPEPTGGHVCVEEHNCDESISMAFICAY